MWVSSTEGVCTLVSTNIEDERNVRIISRNIEGGYRIKGLLQEENLKNALINRNVTIIHEWICDGLGDCDRDETQVQKREVLQEVIHGGMEAMVQGSYGDNEEVACQGQQVCHQKQQCV